MDSYRAFSVDIDGNGTEGVLAMRFENIDEQYSVIFPFARIFYIYDGDVLYKDVNHSGFPSSMGILKNNRVASFGSDGGAISYTLFRIENGILIEDFTIYTMMFIYFYRFSGGLWSEWENRKIITEEEFNFIIIEYGLDGRRDMSEDDSKMILGLDYK